MREYDRGSYPYYKLPGGILDYILCKYLMMVLTVVACDFFGSWLKRAVLAIRLGHNPVYSFRPLDILQRNLPPPCCHVKIIFHDERSMPHKRQILAFASACLHATRPVLHSYIPAHQTDPTCSSYEHVLG
jgi:hypothetical protein